MSEKSEVVLDTDLKQMQDAFNKFIGNYNETRAKLSIIEQESKAFEMEIQLLKSKETVDNDSWMKIDHIQKILEQSSELYEKNKSSKKVKQKLKQKILDLENQLNALQETHMRELVQIESQKDEIITKIRLEVEEEKQKCNEVKIDEDMSKTIKQLEAQLKMQERKSENSDAFYKEKIAEYQEEKRRLEEEISKIKDENERLRNRIRKFERNPPSYEEYKNEMTDDSDKNTTCVIKSETKISKKRKIINPHNYEQ